MMVYNVYRFKFKGVGSLESSIRAQLPLSKKIETDQHNNRIFSPYGSAGANRLHSFSKTLHSSDFDIEVTAPFFWDKETNSLDFGSTTKFTKFVGTNSL